MPFTRTSTMLPLMMLPAVNWQHNTCSTWATKIAFVSDFIDDPDAFNSSNRDRLAGYQIALTDAGMAIDVPPAHGQLGAQSAKALTRQLLSL